MNPKPLILLPWYGPWPDYLPLFLDGCRRNPDFQVLLFGDMRPADELPPSVQFVVMPVAEIARRIYTATGVDVNLSRPYKLCDLRPSFGLVFQDYLREREFWGFGDLDVIWGTLKRFASEKVLASADIFCVRKEYVSGSFTLIRNTPLMNSLFMRSPDWKKMFTEPRYFNFDECAQQWHDLIFGARYEELNSPVCSFSEVVFQAIEKGEIRGYFETVALEDVHSRVDVTERGVYEFWVGYALFHFIMVKRRVGFVYPKWSQVPQRYHLTRRGLLLEGEVGCLKPLASLRYLRMAKKLAAKAQCFGHRILSRLPKKD